MVVIWFHGVMHQNTIAHKVKRATHWEWRQFHKRTKSDDALVLIL
jgi:hypothetical protein